MKATYIVIFVFTAVCGVILAYVSFRPKAGRHDVDYWRSRMGKENLSVDLDLPSGYVSPYRLAEGQDYARLVSGWSEAATNLVAGDISGMETSIAKVSERMKTIPLGQRDEITQPFYAILKKRLDYKCVSDIFTDDVEFEAYMMATIKGMNLSAEIELNSYLVPSSAGKWEYMALATLKAYNRSFSASGRKTLGAAASKLIKELTEQIESSHGLTYRYMHWLLKEHIRLDGGNENRERILRGIRTEAYPLKVDGCEPKWLEEFK